VPAARDFVAHRVAVTGGAGALGAAVVGQLLARGAEVFIPVFDEAELALFPFADHPKVHLTSGVDLARDDHARAFYEAIPGALWASIHLVGGFAMAPLAETSGGDLERLLRVNAVTCFNACREATGRMGDRGGRLVNVAAKPALIPRGGMTAYAASKAAVASITACLAEELAGRGVWVNAVAPSIMDTPANRRSMPDADPSAWPTTDDVAAAILSLASPDNRCLRGAVAPVYGRSGVAST